MTEQTDFLVQIFHRGICGMPAFLHQGYPERGSVRDSSKARHLDGSKIKHGSVMVCDSCGETVNQNYLSWRRPQ